MRNLYLILYANLLSCVALSQVKYEANWTSLDSRPTPQWFEDAKFGIFIHWGLFSVPAYAPTETSVYEKYAEWYWWRLTDEKSRTHGDFKSFHQTNYGDSFRYQDFVKDFKCELYDPDQWADIIQQSGARYVVLTSKHHEGFTLWPSEHAWNWNAMDVGPHRDLAGDLVTSVRKKGLRMGFYYSLYEWFNPLYRSNVANYVDSHMLPQMKDLVMRYKPDIFWTDGEWDHPSEIWKSTSFLSWLYNDSPVKNEVVVNDRWGKETRSVHGGIYTTEYDLIHEESSTGKKIDHPWEECRGIGGSFGYNRKEDLADYATSRDLVRILVDKVARGGNLLLNIGPTADGRIPVIMQQRLADIGQWLKVNGEAIYGSRKWDKSPTYNKDTQVYYTTKGKDLYVICTTFPKAAFQVSGVKSPAKVAMLGTAEKVPFQMKGNTLTIMPPVIIPASNPCDYAWVFKVEGGL